MSALSTYPTSYISMQSCSSMLTIGPKYFFLDVVEIGTQISMIVASGSFGKLAFSGTGSSCRADNVGAELGGRVRALHV